MDVFVEKNIPYIWSTLEETAWKFNKTQDEIQKILPESRKKLLAEREKRPKPHLDDKIITAWNGLMISAFSRAYQVLGDPYHLAAAERAATFVVSRLYDPGNARLFRRYRDGEARFDDTLQDYAFFIQGLLDLYEASFDIRWLALAIDLAKKQIELFEDPEQGGFFIRWPEIRRSWSGQKTTMTARSRRGIFFAALSLLHLAHMTGNKEWRRPQKGRLMRRAPLLGNIRRPTLRCWPPSTAPVDAREIIIAGNPDAEDTGLLLKEVHAHFVPNKILLVADGGEGQKKLTQFLPFIERMTATGGKATAYVCENYSCQLPTSDPSVLGQLLLKQENIHNNLP